MFLQGEQPVLLTANGAPISEKKASLTVGPRGPMLLQDFVYLDEMSHFARERIPERVVHAKGAGMFAHNFLKLRKKNYIIGTAYIDFMRNSQVRLGTSKLHMTSPSIARLKCFPLSERELQSLYDVPPSAVKAALPIPSGNK